MKKNRETHIRSCFLVIVMSLLMVGGCGKEEKPASDGASSGKLVVVCANYPLKYFAERIGGERVQLQLLVPADQDPAFWKPSPADISAMQQADLVLLNGAGYEHWLSWVAISEKKLVDTSSGFRDQLIQEAGGVTHQHGPGGEHTHGEVAFTTWLDLSLANRQAQAVGEALQRLLPEQALALQPRLTSLTNDLMALDDELQNWGRSLEGQPLIASHPVYQYFARRYGLNLRSVHWEPEVMPDAAGWRELEALLGEHPARSLIWEGKPADAIVERLRTFRVDSIVFSPCANTPVMGDFLEVMRRQVSEAAAVEKKQAEHRREVLLLDPSSQASHQQTLPRCHLFDRRSDPISTGFWPRSAI